VHLNPAQKGWQKDRGKKISIIRFSHVSACQVFALTQETALSSDSTLLRHLPFG
jgi:hypothetical protein